MQQQQQQQQSSTDGRQDGANCCPGTHAARHLSPSTPPNHRHPTAPNDNKTQHVSLPLDCCILRVCSVQRWRCMRSGRVTNQTARPADFQGTRRTDRRVHHFSHSQPPSFLTSENVNAVVEHRRGVQRPLTRSAAVRRALHLRPSPDRRHGFRGGGWLASQALSQSSKGWVEGENPTRTKGCVSSLGRALPFPARR